ncbi:hypothetical protein ASE11_23165 [Hydrogenophaga sp. Root209]|uniref:hypothetical protein n=1 Tax=Hydrogenophaga sp. Root209 TaxID=1736490 RepID=UPI0006F32C7A|nr:hypothetical protein [Hydrogenophaga sp. Root209]KRC08662.1 hypothetical protein ASE11_23165 [Hydrogenophaga sp. Root209]
MKRSNAVIAAAPNRRSLIQHHLPLLNDAEVVAFLDNTAPPRFSSLSYKLVQANEPALLIELIWMTQARDVSVCVVDAANHVAPLHDGFLDYLLQHIDEVPCLNKLSVQQVTLPPQRLTRWTTSPRRTRPCCWICSETTSCV